ncbi:MAG: hypothetical protein RJB26_1375 [Pseudomonadota bacterium]|jgi:hypothetical protein
MNPTSNPLFVVLRSAAFAGALLPWLAGCGEAPAPAQTKTAADAARVEHITRDLVEGVPMGKPVAPVEVKFGLMSSPQPGVPFKVRVVLLPGATVPTMDVEVSGSEGLVLLDPVAPVTLERVSAGSVREVTVTAQAPTAGGFVLNVAVTLDDPLGEQTRVLAFPVLVGGSALPAPPSRAKTGVGATEAVVPLAGTESTR